jgi:NTP pyrophosphatase (non-canonical NTP hydrolase)
MKTSNATFTRVQAAHRIWAARNFPDTTADQTLQGMMEELGELAAAENLGDKEDAVGDVLIYALHHANLIGVELGVIAAEAIWRAGKAQHMYVFSATMESWALRNAVVALGRLAHARLKRAQGILMEEDHALNEIIALGDIVGAMELMAIRLSTQANPGSAASVLAKVWDGIVSKRDWKADAVDGGGHSHVPDAPMPEPGTAPKPGAFGPNPHACFHPGCDYDFTIRGAVAYKMGQQDSCAEHFDPNWRDEERA